MVSHDLAAIRQTAHRMIFLEQESGMMVVRRVS